MAAWDSGHAYEQYVGRWSRKIATDFLAKVTKPGGRVAAYVWDYAGGMQMMRHFWDAAIAVSPDDAKLDQAERFPLCQPGPLKALFERTEVKSVSVRAIDIPTVFQDFDDDWTPFLGRTGAAPTYLASVGGEVQRSRQATGRGRSSRLASATREGVCPPRRSSLLRPRPVGS